MPKTKTRKLTDGERNRSALIGALFAVFIHAWKTDNAEKADDARHELELLGIGVQIKARETQVVVREIEIDPQTKAVVIQTGSDFEWGVFVHGEAQVTSDERYGDVNCALRDALMYATLGVVPVSDIESGHLVFAADHDGLIFHSHTNEPLEG